VLTGTVNENTEILTGFVEKGAQVTVILGDNQIRAAVSDSGVFTAPLPPMTAGDVLVVACRDAAGNTAEASVTVQLGTRGAIQAAVAPVVHLGGAASLSGTATADRELRIVFSVGGKERASHLVKTDGDGLWTFDAGTDVFAHDELVDVTVAYSDGRSPEADANASFLIDGRCDLTADQQEIDENTTAVSGKTDPGAQVRLAFPNNSFTKTAGEDGSFAFEGLSLTAGETLAIYAEDALGHTAELAWQIAAGERKDIALALLTKEEGFISAADGLLTLTGSAEPGFALSLSLGGAQQRIETDERGAFAMRLDPAAYSDGALTIAAAYADGFRPECAAQMEMTVDRSAPPLAVDTLANAQVEINTAELIVHTEPNATLILRAPKGESRWQADAQGEAAIPLPDQKVGAIYVIAAVDAAGNETLTSIEMIEQIRDARVLINRPRKSDTIRGGKLGISASILATNDISLYYVVTDQGEEVIRGDVEKADLREMSEKDYAEMAAQYDDLVGSYTGSTIRASVELPPIESDSLVLGIYTDDMGEEPVLLAEQSFKSGLSEKIEGVDDDSSGAQDESKVYDIVTTQTNAFGLDPVAADAFNPKQVYLTGYNVSEGNRTMYFDFVIDGERYTTQEISAAGGSAKTTYSSRPVDKEFPDLVPDIKPNTRRGGLIFMLDLSFLEPGEHEVSVVLISNSNTYRMESRKVVISADVPTDRNITKTIQNRWK